MVLIYRPLHLSGPDPPFRIVSVKSLFRKCVSASSPFEIKTVGQLGGPPDLDAKKRYRIESLCYGEDRVSARQNFCEKATVV